MNIEIYEKIILEPVVMPFSDTLFKGQCWIFQQDSRQLTIQNIVKMACKQCSCIYSIRGANIW